MQPQWPEKEQKSEQSKKAPLAFSPFLCQLTKATALHLYNMYIIDFLMSTKTLFVVRVFMK